MAIKLEEYELTTDLQERAVIFINEVYKFTSPFGKFHSALINNDEYIQICFTGCGITGRAGFAIEALYNETDIPKLARYCVTDVLTKAVLRHLRRN